MLKWPDIHVIGIFKGEERVNRPEVIFEERMAKDF